jgi:isopentenyl-diphosphate delta-isomerase
VFLFNSKNELLIQKRAKKKITFPSYWANTCWSHPLFIKEEMEENNNIGIKKAAIRKLEHELGINKQHFQVADLKYATTVLYKVRMKE